MLHEFGRGIADFVEFLRYPNSHRPADNATRSIRTPLRREDAGFASVGGTRTTHRGDAHWAERGDTWKTTGSHAKARAGATRRASEISAYGPPPEFKSYLHESDT
jgi:hypothetical protein